MKSKEEIEQLAFLQYPRLINDPYNPMEDDNTYERQIWIDAYTQCQEDNKDKKYTEEDIKMYIKAFHLDVLEGIYSKEKLKWCNDWLKQNLNKQD